MSGFAKSNRSVLDVEMNEGCPGLPWTPQCPSPRNGIWTRWRLRCVWGSSGYVRKGKSSGEAQGCLCLWG